MHEQEAEHNASMSHYRIIKCEQNLFQTTALNLDVNHPYKLHPVHCGIRKTGPQSKVLNYSVIFDPGDNDSVFVTFPDKNNHEYIQLRCRSTKVSVLISLYYEN